MTKFVKADGLKAINNFTAPTISGYTAGTPKLIDLEFYQGDWYGLYEVEYTEET